MKEKKNYETPRLQSLNLNPSDNTSLVDVVIILIVVPTT